MRKVKFRGKRKDNDKWVKGAYREYRGKHQIGLNIADEGFYWQWFDVIPETVGEYIGMNDINDTKIYEGDIIVSSEYPFKDREERIYVGLIKFVDFYYCAELHCVVSDRNGISTGLEKNISEIYELQVIGNKHDNPELLG